MRGKGYVRALDHLEGDGRPLFELCRTQRLEGVVAKRAASPYRQGPKRSDDWIKIKSERDDEFVVVGFLLGKGARSGLGALCVASYSGEQLVYRGRVGSGLDVHPITCSLGVATRHYDVRYLAVAPAGSEAIRSVESVDLQWFDWDDLPEGAAPDLPLLIAQARARL